MDAKEKVQFYSQARWACIIIGIIMSVLSGIIALLSAGMLIYVVTVTALKHGLYMQPHPYSQPYSVDDVSELVAINSVMTAFLIFSLLEFTFSVLLADGAWKSRSGYLRTFLIYGNIRNKVGIILNVLLILSFWWSWVLVSLPVWGIGAASTRVAKVVYKTIQSSSEASRFDEEVQVQCEK